MKWLDYRRGGQFRGSCNRAVWKMKGNSLVVQWLGLSASTAGGMGSIPVGELKIMHASLAKKREDEGHSNRIKEDEGRGTSLGNVFGRQN